MWCTKFGAVYARRLKREHRGYGDTFCIAEVFVKINGKQHYLWRVLDRDGEVGNVYLQAKRNGVAARRFFSRLLRAHAGEHRKIVTDKLRSYGVAPRELIPETIHSTQRYENSRAEQYHAATRVRERGMHCFKKAYSEITENLLRMEQPTAQKYITYCLFTVLGSLMLR